MVMNRGVVMRDLLAALPVAAALVVATGDSRAQADPDAWEARHNAYQPPARVMDAIGIEPGMVVAEVGAGRGRYVVHMARRVGDEGTIYANDIDDDKLEYLRHRCARDGIPNVVTVLGEVTDPHLPQQAMDIVYIINTYHHLDQPVELMANILPSLKPDGRLVIIEHDADKMGEDGHHTTPQNLLIDQAYRAGYALVRIETFLERDNINIFRPRDTLAGHRHGEQPTAHDEETTQRLAAAHHEHDRGHAADAHHGHGQGEHSANARRATDLARDRWMWQQPRKVMDAIGVEAGMVIADVGAGYGYFTFPLAERVGDTGHVYANDIDANALHDIDARCREQGTTNVTTILGGPDDPRLPAAAVDVVLVVNTIHLIDEHERFLRHVKRSLQPGGSLVIVQWAAKKMDAEIDLIADDRERYSAERVRRQVAGAGFAIERVETFLPMQDIFICRAE
jgi:ubiquinone/menaquinone biosynthesis C-methylase UbiE